MDWAPIARIAIRYIVGAIIGMDAGATLAGDPDVVTVVALAIGMVVEVAYGIAKRKGWAT
ncbi:MAG: hypothetical protein MUD11_07470 [Rhodobacteraceae bacterium]|jgi:hypothetical protein|nr:hypothetical protein [Paracoccaceae bacterium]